MWSNSLWILITEFSIDFTIFLESVGHSVVGPSKDTETFQLKKIKKSYDTLLKRNVKLNTVGIGTQPVVLKQVQWIWCLFLLRHYQTSILQQCSLLSIRRVPDLEILLKNWTLFSIAIPPENFSTGSPCAEEHPVANGGRVRISND